MLLRFARNDRGLVSDLEGGVTPSVIRGYAEVSNDMMIIPAIDIKGGRCVRLRQGRMDQETVYFEDPVEIAKIWEKRGAERLHIIDLDGAFEGYPAHIRLVEKIRDSIGIPIQLGGGIRDLNIIRDYISMGIDQIIIGTIACMKPEILKSATQEFPERIILAIDAKDGKVAIEGWKTFTDIEARDIVRNFLNLPLYSIIYTDIRRDGMEKGPNLDGIKRFVSSTSIPVIASGGITTMEDIEEILQMEYMGIIGMIIGRALYSGRLRFEDILKMLKKS